MKARRRGATVTAMIFGRFLRRRTRTRTRAWDRSTRSGARPGTGLSVCPECAGDCMYPQSRHRLADDRWWLQLRCGQCQVRIEQVIPVDLLERLDADVAWTVAGMRSELAALDLENMAMEAELFAMALRRDLIGPGDFR